MNNFQTPQSTSGNTNQTELRATFDKFVVQRPKMGSWVGELAEGLTAPLIGMRVVLSRRMYLTTFLVPVLVQTVISIGLIVLLLFFGQWVTGLLHGGIMSIVAWVSPAATLRSSSALSSPEASSAEAIFPAGDVPAPTVQLRRSMDFFYDRRTCDCNVPRPSNPCRS